MNNPGPAFQVLPGRDKRLVQFLRDYYIYFVMVAVIVVLSTANLDQFGLFERGNFLLRTEAVEPWYERSRPWKAGPVVRRM